MIEAVVFDFDGLIFDTETPEYQSWSEVYQEFGAELSLDIWSAWIGSDSSGFNPYDYLEELTGKTVNRAEVRSLRRHKYESLTGNADLRPGVRDYIGSAKDMGLEIGLASSSSRNWVVSHLERFSLLSYFDCVRTRDNVRFSKPDPELYIQAMECLQVSPDHSIAFEDSPNGALAAKRAGMLCVVVPNELTRSLKFPQIEYRLESMEQLSLSTLIAKLSQS